MQPATVQQPVDTSRRRGAADDADHQRADHATHQVHAHYVERIVISQTVFQLDGK
ncbi:Uncharacterised protein [Mycobacteroides abscessus subsp. abscessus]|nr:Uncharacterised protein [Mycobacteroides abscessus subsp. abscessus]